MLSLVESRKPSLSLGWLSLLLRCLSLLLFLCIDPIHKPFLLRLRAPNTQNIIPILRSHFLFPKCNNPQHVFQSHFPILCPLSNEELLLAAEHFHEILKAYDFVAGNKVLDLLNSLSAKADHKNSAEHVRTVKDSNQNLRL